MESFIQTVKISPGVKFSQWRNSRRSGRAGSDGELTGPPAGAQEWAVSHLLDPLRRRTDTRLPIT